MKLQKLDDLLLNLVVVFEARRIKGVTPLWAAKQLVICVRLGNKRSNMDTVASIRSSSGAAV